MLVAIGNRGINTDQIQYWVFTPAHEEERGISRQWCEERGESFMREVPAQLELFFGSYEGARERLAAALRPDKGSHTVYVGKEAVGLHEVLCEHAICVRRDV